jgi:hypothetical protein
MRHSVFREAYAADAEELCRHRAKDSEIAKYFGVRDTTIAAWRRNVGFWIALKRGRAEDPDTERSFYDRAVGYDYVREQIGVISKRFYCNKTKRLTRIRVTTVQSSRRIHVPADVRAAMHWLRMHRPEEWGNKRKGTGALIVHFSPEVAKLMEQSAPTAPQTPMTGSTGDASSGS